MSGKRDEYKRLVQRTKRRRKKTALIIIAVILLQALIAACSFAVYAGKTVKESAVKDINADELYSLIYQKTRIYDSDGKEIDSLYLSGGNRTVISYSDIPEELINAFIDTEDRTFWEHHGFNYIRMLGAVKEKLFGGGEIRGTSTITQQLARNIYLADTKSERTLQRKILEAYYTRLLEKELSKEQIMEAYLNVVYFGFDSYGIAEASDRYFGKEPKDLDLAECAALAALPQSPDTYALVRTGLPSDDDLPVLKKEEGIAYKYNGKISEDRRALILSNMEKEGHITAAEKETALSSSLEEHIHVNTEKNPGSYTYYIDCAVEEAAEDIAKEYGVSKEEAKSMIYTKGYEIYTCLDRDVQAALETEINNDSNYASLRYIRKDAEGNIISSSGKVLMRPSDSFFDAEGNFTLGEEEYTEAGNGDILLYKDHRLDFFSAESAGIKYAEVSFKGMFEQDGGALSFLEGGGLLIPAGYTKLDGDGNCVISSSFVKEHPNFFIQDGGKLSVSSDNYRLGQRMRQPQAAAVIIDNSTGCVLAMTGGRGAEGKKLYNRATSPRQPGSSIKPIAVYGPALQRSADAAQSGETLHLSEEKGDSWGDYITAGSIINDAAIYLNGRAWPKNSYGGYKGKMTLRKAVQQSVNVAAVKVFRQIGADYSIQMLKKNGITSIVEDGETNDINDALSLGGMTKGISPLELTAAYETFANGGIYTKPRFYSRIADAGGSVILENEAETETVYSEGVAWIMTDILRTAVLYGTGKNARVAGQDVAGKTGTTSSQYDVWFAGFTPRYSMALWMGSDVNIELSNYSSAAAAFWSKIMGEVCEGLPHESFSEMPDSVEKIRGEYYVKGTHPPAAQVYTREKTKVQTEQTEATTDSFDSYFDDEPEYQDNDDDFDSYFED